MAKTDEQRGPIAAWLRRERLARGWTQKDVADRLGIGEISYRAYEAGPRVSKPVREALEAIYGTPAPDPNGPVAARADVSELVSAIGEQTAALNAQAAAINRLIDRLAAPASPDPEALAEALGEALASHLAPLLAERQRDRLTGAAQ